MIRTLHRYHVSLALPLVYCLLLLACPLSKPPTESQLTTIAKASESIARYTDDGIKIVASLYKGNLLGKTVEENLTVKDLFAAKFQVIATNGVKFQGLLVTYRQQYPSGVAPPSVYAILVTNFEPITTSLLELLNETTHLPPNVAKEIILGLRALMAAITVIATGLATQSVVINQQLQKIKTFASTRLPDLTADERKLYDA